MAKQSGVLRYTGKLGTTVGYKTSDGSFMRERAATISNPRTYAQAKQRAKARPAAMFYAAFENVLNHAFIPEGRASKNRNKFISAAMRLNEVPDVFKGQKRIPVLPYQISEGSLPLDFLCRGTREGNDGITFVNLKSGEITKDSTIAAASSSILQNTPMLQEGMELTFLIVMGDADDLSIRWTGVISFVLDTQNTGTDLGSVVPSELSVLGSSSGFAVGSGDDNMTFVYSVGLIVSSKTTSSWAYSTGFMNQTGRAMDGLDVDEDSVIRSYMDPAASRESDKILQQADNATESGLYVRSFDNVAFTKDSSHTGTTSVATAAVATLSNGNNVPIVRLVEGNPVITNYANEQFVNVQYNTTGQPPIQMDMLLEWTTWSPTNYITVEQFEQMRK